MRLSSGVMLASHVSRCPRQAIASFDTGLALQVYLKAGLPRLRPFPAAVKGWLQQVAATTDFQYALMNMLFLPQRPLVLVRALSPHSSAAAVLQSAAASGRRSRTQDFKPTCGST